VLAKEQKKNQLKKRNRKKKINHTRKVCILALELTVLDTDFKKIIKIKWRM